jgi:hypothetical protein
MAESARHLATIDARLRFALFGLECSLVVEFVVTDVERIFHDAVADPVSAKEYHLFERNGTRVTGHVDEYEPEGIWIRIEGGPVAHARLDEVFERAEYQLARLEKTANTARVAKSPLRLDQPDC